MVGSARAARSLRQRGVMGLPAAALAQASSARRASSSGCPEALGDWDWRSRSGPGIFARWSAGSISGSAIRSTRCRTMPSRSTMRSPRRRTRSRPRFESVGLVQPFERGLDQGIAMIITDQGIQEADALRPAHHQPGRVQRRHHQRHAGRDLRPRPDRQDRHHRARQRQSGLDLDRQAPERQQARHRAVQRRQRHELPVRGVPRQQLRRADRIDPEVDRADRPEGDDLVAAIGTGNPNPIVQALKERGIEPGTIAVGSTDIRPRISSRSPRAGCSGASTSNST